MNEGYEKFFAVGPDEIIVGDDEVLEGREVVSADKGCMGSVIG